MSKKITLRKYIMKEKIRTEIIVKTEIITINIKTTIEINNIKGNQGPGIEINNIKKDPEIINLGKL